MKKPSANVRRNQTAASKEREALIAALTECMTNCLAPHKTRLHQALLKIASLEAEVSNLSASVRDLQSRTATRVGS
jgi:hypothetical protein